MVRKIEMKGVKKLSSSNNNSSNNNSKSAGIGFTGLLAITFIILKLCGVITWSWLWILSPIWIPLALVLVVSIIYIIISLVIAK